MAYPPHSGTPNRAGICADTLYIKTPAFTVISVTAILDDKDRPYTSTSSLRDVRAATPVCAPGIAFAQSRGAEYFLKTIGDRKIAKR